MKPQAQKLLLTAVEAKDYRSFIRLAMACRYAHRVMPLSELAEKAGFSSKGYISDLLAGKKKITRQALPRLAQALNLPSRLERYFTLLAEREEASLRAPGVSEKEIDLQLRKLRRAFQDRAEEAGKSVRHEPGIYHHRIYKLYAGLGSVERGASLAEIVKRTAMAEEVAREGLGLLVALKLAYQKGDRFFASAGNIEALGLDKESRFQEVLGTALAAFARKLQAGPTNKDCFFYASFALSEAKELELKT